MRGDKLLSAKEARRIWVMEDFMEEKINAESSEKQKQDSALSDLSGSNLQEDLAGTSLSQGNRLPRGGHLTEQ